MLSSSAAPWQRLLTAEILQLHALRSSCHSRPCRTLVSSLNSNSASSLLSVPCDLNCTANPQLSLNHLIGISRDSIPQSSPQLAWSPRCIALGRSQKKTFPNNSSIIACVFVAAGTCLPGCCLTMNVSSGFTISAFRRHVTI
jgi:hypothetical protein